MVEFDSDILMPIAIIIIMFGIGLSLKFENFKRVFIKPKGIIIGLICQLLILPLIAFILIYYWPINPVYKVGVIIIASAPGGTASNLVTHMLKGRVALSVSLTSFNSFAILFTIPVYVNLALNCFLGKQTEISISFAETFKEIFFTVLIPVLAGISVNEYMPSKYTDKIKSPLRIILPLLLLGVFALALFSNKENQTSNILDHLSLVIPLLILNIITIFSGFYISGLFGIKHKSNFTIAIEMGLQNSALAIFIASRILENDKMEIAAVIYSSFSFFSTWFFAWIMKHYLRKNNSNL